MKEFTYRKQFALNHGQGCFIPPLLWFFQQILKQKHFFTALSTLLLFRKPSFSINNNYNNNNNKNNNNNNNNNNKSVSNPLTTIFTQFSSDHTKPCKNTYLRIRTSGFNYLLPPLRIKTIGLYLQKTLPSRAVF